MDKSPEAVAAGSVGPWDPGGISEFQLNAGRELASVKVGRTSRTDRASTERRRMPLGTDLVSRPSRLTERVSSYSGVARRTLRDRLPEVAAAACTAFIEKGYRRTHVSDVASRLGLSQGAVYATWRQEALFALALTHAIGSPPLDGLELPVRARAPTPCWSP